MMYTRTPLIHEVVLSRFSQDIERMVMKKIDRVANIIEVKISKMETKNNECSLRYTKNNDY